MALSSMPICRSRSRICRRALLMPSSLETVRKKEAHAAFIYAEMATCMNCAATSAASYPPGPPPTMTTDLGIRRSSVCAWQAPSSRRSSWQEPSSRAPSSRPPSWQGLSSQAQALCRQPVPATRAALSAGPRPHPTRSLAPRRKSLDSGTSRSLQGRPRRRRRSKHQHPQSDNYAAVRS